MAKRSPGNTWFVMIWRFVVAGYVALAAVVGIADGGSGLAILAFFYFLAAVIVAYILAWNWLSREAGRRYFRWLTGAR